MKAKFIIESNILKPKSDEDIFKALEKEEPIEDAEDATKHLRAAIGRKILPYVKYALKYGGLVLNTPKSGNLWVAFNENVNEDIIIELINQPQIIRYFENFGNFRRTILGKIQYMAMENVANHVLNTLGEYITEHDMFTVIYETENQYAWEGSEKVLNLYKKFKDDMQS